MPEYPTGQASGRGSTVQKENSTEDPGSSYDLYQK